eukprot:COSAG02_NODE_27701_length_604_cov_1.021782_2_plen_22_part_01
MWSGQRILWRVAAFDFVPFLVG